MPSPTEPFSIEEVTKGIYGSETSLQLIENIKLYSPKNHSCYEATQLMRQALSHLKKLHRDDVGDIGVIHAVLNTITSAKPADNVSDRDELLFLTQDLSEIVDHRLPKQITSSDTSLISGIVSVMQFYSDEKIRTIFNDFGRSVNAGKVLSALIGKCDPTLLKDYVVNLASTGPNVTCSTLAQWSKSDNTKKINSDFFGREILKNMFDTIAISLKGATIESHTRDQIQYFIRDVKKKYASIVDQAFADSTEKNEVVGNIYQTVAVL
jgi:hypothetical protein